MDIDKEKWSGDGDFTERLLAVLSEMASVSFLRVEDAPASRSDAGFSFISNEIFVKFREVPVAETVKLAGAPGFTVSAAGGTAMLTGLFSVRAAVPEVSGPTTLVTTTS